MSCFHVLTKDFALVLTFPPHLRSLFTSLPISVTFFFSQKDQLTDTYNEAHTFSISIDIGKCDNSLRTFTMVSSCVEEERKVASYSAS